MVVFIGNKKLVKQAQSARKLSLRQTIALDASLLTAATYYALKALDACNHKEVGYCIC
jgi:hypothetical protein